MDLGGEPEATHALNQHNPKLHYKHVSLHQQVSVVFNPHQENLALQQTEITTENYVIKNTDSWNPVPEIGL